MTSEAEILQIIPAPAGMRLKVELADDEGITITSHVVALALVRRALDASTPKESTVQQIEPWIECEAIAAFIPVYDVWAKIRSVEVLHSR